MKKKKKTHGLTAEWMWMKISSQVYWDKDMYSNPSSAFLKKNIII